MEAAIEKCIGRRMEWSFMVKSGSRRCQEFVDGLNLFHRNDFSVEDDSDSEENDAEPGNVPLTGEMKDATRYYCDNANSQSKTS